MATSRTGTTKWLKLRAQVIYRAKRDGITHCPNCGGALDYDRPRLPNSAEVDHVVPYSQGGQDVIDNVRVWCRDCNGKRQSREWRAAKGLPAPIPQRTKASRTW